MYVKKIHILSTIWLSKSTFPEKRSKINMSEVSKGSVMPTVCGIDPISGCDRHLSFDHWCWLTNENAFKSEVVRSKVKYRKKKVAPGCEDKKACVPPEDFVGSKTDFSTRTMYGTCCESFWNCVGGRWFWKYSSALLNVFWNTLHLWNIYLKMLFSLS